MTKRFIRRLAAATEGVAMIEFAFIGPILLVVIMGGLELANFALAHMRVSQMAMTVADNSGRVTVSIDEANIYEVFAGAGLIGEPLDFEDHGRIVLSSLQPNNRTGSRRGQVIHWQRCWGDLDVDPNYGVQGTGRNNASLRTGMGRSGNRITAADGTAVMFVEVTYDYQPLVGDGWVETPTIYYESAFNVRGRQNQDITNGQSLTTLSCG